MGKKSYLYRKLCPAFCFYYKPGKNEELVCRGYEVVERLLQKKTKISFNESGRKGEQAIVEALVKKMCTTCNFFAQDCDFMQDRSAHPCGGFALLAQLLGSGVIVLDEIK